MKKMTFADVLFVGCAAFAFAGGRLGWYAGTGFMMTTFKMGGGLETVTHSFSAVDSVGLTYRFGEGKINMRNEIFTRNRYGLACFLLAACSKKATRLMRENGLNASRRRRFVPTTDSNHGLKVCENILNRKFHA